MFAVAFNPNLEVLGFLQSRGATFSGEVRDKFVLTNSFRVAVQGMLQSFVGKDPSSARMVELVFSRYTREQQNYIVDNFLT